MNRIVKLAMVAGAGLLVLALAASLLPVSRPQAQEGVPPQNDGRISGEPAPAQPDAEMDAVSAYLQVAGAALRPENSADVESAVPTTGYAGCIYAESGDPNGYWNAPTYPPQGATLTKLGVYVYDASDTANSRFSLGVIDATGNVLYEWGGYSAGNSGNTLFEIGISNHQVDYANYSYLLWWRPTLVGPNMKICGFRLYYTPPGATSYLPSVMKGD